MRRARFGVRPSIHPTIPAAAMTSPILFGRSARRLRRSGVHCGRWRRTSEEGIVSGARRILCAVTLRLLRALTLRIVRKRGCLRRLVAAEFRAVWAPC